MYRLFLQIIILTTVTAGLTNWHIQTVVWRLLDITAQMAND
jgi:hypothetical protein